VLNLAVAEILYVNPLPFYLQQFATPQPDGDTGDLVVLVAGNCPHMHFCTLKRQSAAN
jgi:hypothetical protein